MTLARPMFPPPVETSYTPADWGRGHPAKPEIWAAEDGHPIAALIILRQAAAATIERLLAFLDVTDGLEVEEQVDDQPCDTDELDDDPSDYEPSLGAIESHPNPYRCLGDLHGYDDQSQWAAGGTDDREEQCDDAPIDDNERDDDRDSGVADLDGLLEQFAGDPRSLVASGSASTGYARGVE